MRGTRLIGRRREGRPAGRGGGGVAGRCRVSPSPDRLIFYLFFWILDLNLFD